MAGCVTRNTSDACPSWRSRDRGGTAGHTGSGMPEGGREGYEEVPTEVISEPKQTFVGSLRILGSLLLD